MELSSFPNQKRIMIRKNEAGPFMQINLADLAQASQVLNYSEFKLFLYLAGNRNSYVTELSPQDFWAKYGVSRASYNRAVAGLIDHGYLRLVDGNFYEFYTQSDLC